VTGIAPEGAFLPWGGPAAKKLPRQLVSLPEAEVTFEVPHAPF
jgi:hypothetical protein